MKFTVNNWYDDQNGEYIATKYYIDNEEVIFEEYRDLIESFTEENYEEECDGNCEECTLHTESSEQPENQFLRAVTDEINDVLEMFENPTTCDDCKGQALMGLVMLGIDGALQGCIGKKEENEVNENLN